MNANLIPLPEYAAKVGRGCSAVRRKCLRGTLPGAVKIGRDWLIPENAPYPDNRVRTGEYKNRRKHPAE